jgi:dTDP-4-dehydrorhamnose reductase
MNNKVLITGSGGFVGSNLYCLLKGSGYNTVGIDISKKGSVDRVIDIKNRLELFKILDEFRPEVIIHTAALSNVEKCETEKELALENNVVPTKLLAEWSAANEALMIFFSSDYVYDGGQGNFTEKDAPHPLQYYGWTKLEGEKIVSLLKKHIILRSTVIYGWDPEGMNFFMQLYRNQMNKKEMKVPLDQISNPTYVIDLCELILKIIKTPDCYGVYVATGPESLSRYEFSCRICEFMGWEKNFIKPVETKNLGQAALRPLNNSTSSQKAINNFNFIFNPLETNLKILKKQIAENL